VPGSASYPEDALHPKGRSENQSWFVECTGELLPGIVGCNASAHPDIHRGADANSHTKKHTKIREIYFIYQYSSLTVATLIPTGSCKDRINLSREGWYYSITYF
ncbi:MAG: hypothetical protein QME16_03145, partial [Planctomycetota bacterium]|nr:hypothetical protein [Planctomycetota bacterium]